MLDVRLVDTTNTPVGTSLNPLQVVGGGGGGGSYARAIATIQYVVTASGTGVNVNDIITQNDSYDLTTSPPTYISTIWRNETQATTLSGAPTAGTFIQNNSTAVLGTTADNPVNYTSGTPWYAPVASLMSYLKLSIAAALGAGSHIYTYTGSQLTSDAWTLFGTTRTKTYTYTGSQLTSETDWV